MKKFLLSKIPHSARPLLRKIYYFPSDFMHKLSIPESMVPPRSKVFVGNGDFKEIGQEFKKYLIELAGLKPTHKVLDVGCGIGRMAIPLTEYISGGGEYYGIDIVQDGIKWCSDKISSRYNNFHFIHADVFNKHYNPKGCFSASKYKFPFPNDMFDVVLLTSVFTHMQKIDVENYLSEISRVLTPGGRCLITFFLINEESIEACKSGVAALDFKYELDGFFTTNNETPEAAIAYRQDYVERIFEGHGLDLSSGIHFGSWCGRKTFLSCQDIVVAQKHEHFLRPGVHRL